MAEKELDVVCDTQRAFAKTFFAQMSGIHSAGADVFVNLSFSLPISGLNASGRKSRARGPILSANPAAGDLSVVADASNTTHRRYQSVMCPPGASARNVSSMPTTPTAGSNSPGLFKKARELAPRPGLRIQLPDTVSTGESHSSTRDELALAQKQPGSPAATDTSPAVDSTVTLQEAPQVAECASMSETVPATADIQPQKRSTLKRRTRVTLSTPLNADIAGSHAVSGTEMEARSPGAFNPKPANLADALGADRFELREIIRQSKRWSDGSFGLQQTAALSSMGAQASVEQQASMQSTVARRGSADDAGLSARTPAVKLDTHGHRQRRRTKVATNRLSPEELSALMERKPTPPPARVADPVQQHRVNGSPNLVEAGNYEISAQAVCVATRKAPIVPTLNLKLARERLDLCSDASCIPDTPR